MPRRLGGGPRFGTLTREYFLTLTCERRGQPVTGGYCRNRSAKSDCASIALVADVYAAPLVPRQDVRMHAREKQFHGETLFDIIFTLS